MTKNPSFEIVQVDKDYMAVPVGKASASFRGVVTLSETSAFLLQAMETPRTAQQLVTLLMEEYEVDEATARSDVDRIIEQFRSLGMITE